MVHARKQAAPLLRCALASLVMGLSACASMDEAHAPPLAPVAGEVPATQASTNETKSGQNGATPPQPANEAFATVTGQWEGRLSLKLGAFGREPSSGSQMAFELDVKNDQGTLALSTPLGTRMAMVRWQAHAAGGPVQAQLETSDGTQAFASLEDLTQQLLGEALPLQAMLHWLQGHPAPGLPFETPVGQNPSAPSTFMQAGWQVDASELSHGRLNAQREEAPAHRSVTLRLRLDL
jgi:outer membrane lipoprotein LolB